MAGEPLVRGCAAIDTAERDSGGNARTSDQPVPRVPGTAGGCAAPSCRGGTGRTACRHAAGRGGGPSRSSQSQPGHFALTDSRLGTGRSAHVQGQLASTTIFRLRRRLRRQPTGWHTERRIGRPTQYDPGWLTVVDVGHLSLELGMGGHGTPDGVGHTASCCLPRQVSLLRDVRTCEMPVGHFFHFQVVVDVGDLGTLADLGDNGFYRASPTRWHP